MQLPYWCTVLRFIRTDENKHNSDTMINVTLETYLGGESAS